MPAPFAQAERDFALLAAPVTNARTSASASRANPVICDHQLSKDKT